MYQRHSLAKWTESQIKTVQENRNNDDVDKSEDRNVQGEQSGQGNFANYPKPKICGYNQKGSLARLSNLVKKLQKVPSYLEGMTK